MIVSSSVICRRRWPDQHLHGTRCEREAQIVERGITGERDGHVFDERSGATGSIIRRAPAGSRVGAGGSSVERHRPASPARATVTTSTEHRTDHVQPEVGNALLIQSLPKFTTKVPASRRADCSGRRWQPKLPSRSTVRRRTSRAKSRPGQGDERPDIRRAFRRSQTR